ncbi:MAG TPA: chemotaxis protein CheB [Polyangia bacterium]|nr:chemotaxis protein CheB [Polyangia bacterium]
MAGHDIVVIGTSSGGVEALLALLRDLPEDLQAAVFIVMHRNTYTESNSLAEVLARSSKLPVEGAKDGLRFEPGRVYVAHPGRHLVLKGDRMLLTRGPRENRSRPAIDALFRSAALAYGPRVVGVVLTGRLDDGASGLLAIKARGGITVVQEPAEATAPEMPCAAIRARRPDLVAPLAAIPEALVRFVARAAPSEKDFPAPSKMADEVRSSEGKVPGMETMEMEGKHTNIVCPDCGGWMVERAEDHLLLFRCHTGHVYSQQTMLAGQSSELENQLYRALRVVQELAYLTQRLLEQARAEGRRDEVEALEHRLSRAESADRALRVLIEEAAA